jgi:DNA-binding response OmpR family regulator
MSAKRLSVFLVEDEPMIRIMVTDMLEELGHRVVAEAGDLEEGAKLAQSTNFEGKLITPVTELIKARGLAIIFATGYGSEGVPDEIRDLPALAKPFQIEALAKAIDAIFEGVRISSPVPYGKINNHHAREHDRETCQHAEFYFVVVGHRSTVQSTARKKRTISHATRPEIAAIAISINLLPRSILLKST